MLRRSNVIPEPVNFADISRSGHCRLVFADQCARPCIPDLPDIQNIALRLNCCLQAIEKFIWCMLAQQLLICVILEQLRAVSLLDAYSVSTASCSPHAITFEIQQGEDRQNEFK